MLRNLFIFHSDIYNLFKLCLFALASKERTLVCVRLACVRLGIPWHGSPFPRTRLVLMSRWQDWFCHSTTMQWLCKYYLSRSPARCDNSFFFTRHIVCAHARSMLSPRYMRSEMNAALSVAVRKLRISIENSPRSFNLVSLWDRRIHKCKINLFLI